MEAACNAKPSLGGGSDAAFCWSAVQQALRPATSAGAALPAVFRTSGTTSSSAARPASSSGATTTGAGGGAGGGADGAGGLSSSFFLQLVKPVDPAARRPTST